MQIIDLYFSNLPSHLSRTCACIGYFDGLHLGHDALIKETISLAYKKAILTSLITFYPDPYFVLKKEKRQHIQSFKERLKSISDRGIDITYILHFDEEIAGMSPHVFISELLNKLNIDTLICGFDFRFGYLGQGDFTFLIKNNERNFNLVKIKEIADDKGKISSTRIRDCLKNGLIEEANKQLGYKYFVRGKVVKGLQNGRKIAYPTANIAYDLEQLLPLKGVYACDVLALGKIYKGMLNYGYKPTLDRKQLSLEVHLLDFNGDLYDQEITVYFLRRIRPEIKFASLEELAKQLKKDEEICRGLNE